MKGSNAPYQQTRYQIGFDAGKKIKSHEPRILVDTHGLILKTGVQSASTKGRNGAAVAFNKLVNQFPFIETICRDGGYQGSKVRYANPRPVEIVKRNQPGFAVFPKRWIVERTFAWPGINRRLAKDFKRFSIPFMAFIQTATTKLVIRRLAQFQRC